MSRPISREEVALHKTASDCWLIINDVVYDVTPFLDEHPGGAETLLSCAGQDATESFESIGHGEDARAMLPKFRVGVLAAAPVIEPAAIDQAAPPMTKQAPGEKQCCGQLTRLVAGLAVTAAVVGVGVYLWRSRKSKSN